MQNYAEASRNVSMAAIGDYIAQSKKALDKLNSPYMDVRNQSLMLSIVNQAF